MAVEKFLTNRFAGGICGNFDGHIEGMVPLSFADGDRGLLLPLELPEPDGGLLATLRRLRD